MRAHSDIATASRIRDAIADALAAVNDALALMQFQDGAARFWDEDTQEALELANRARAAIDCAHGAMRRRVEVLSDA